MSARNWMGVFRYSSMMRWYSMRLPPACVCTGTFSSRAASLQARRSGSLHVSTCDGLSIPRRRPFAAPSYERMKATASLSPCWPTALAPHVDDGGGALTERVKEYVGAERGHGLGRRRRHLALERCGEAHVVRGAVVVLRHVEQEIVTPVARGVHVRVDEAGRDELASRRQTHVHRARIRAARVDNAVVLVHYVSLLMHHVGLAVVRHHPAAFDECFHGGIDSNGPPPCQDGSFRGKLTSSRACHTVRSTSASGETHHETTATPSLREVEDPPSCGRPAGRRSVGAGHAVCGRGDQGAERRGHEKHGRRAGRSVPPGDGTHHRNLDRHRGRDSPEGDGR